MRAGRVEVGILEETIELDPVFAPAAVRLRCVCWLRGH